MGAHPVTSSPAPSASDETARADSITMGGDTLSTSSSSSMVVVCMAMAMHYYHSTASTVVQHYIGMYVQDPMLGNSDTPSTVCLRI